MGFLNKKRKYSIWVNSAFILFVFFFLAAEAVSEVYDLTLNQRRKYDQIEVEIWAKSIADEAPAFGSASLIIQYDVNYLIPSTVQELQTTDSINFDVNIPNPIDDISSEFHDDNGYSALGSQNYSEGFYSLEVNIITLGDQGIVPDFNGRGSFVGKVTFDIIGNPDDAALTAIEWSKALDSEPGHIRIFDADSNDIGDDVTFTDPDDFTVTGIQVISPNKYGQVIDRDQDYECLPGAYAGGGYPIYFERSINPEEYDSPIDEDLGYLLQYSLNDGGSWSNIGRVAETDKSSSSVGNDPSYISGDVSSPSSSGAYIITNQDGEKLDNSNYRDPIRVLWLKNDFYTERSEQARIKITKLEGAISDEISARNRSDVYDINDERAVLGRLFFLQLNGESNYLKTRHNFSNSTQLTVEAWVNLNEYKNNGSEPGIVVSSAGPGGTEINGSNEGAWALYLEDGRKPAFRVREIEGRGDDGYIAKVVAYYMDSLNAADDTEPLQDYHAKNWVHLAGTVRNNEVCLYVNGELVDKVINNIATDIRMMTTKHPIWIGINPNGSIEEEDLLHAGIKSVKVWRNALTQDEIRERAAGVIDPTDVTLYGDLRRGLELYYSFEGEDDDLASDAIYQNGAEIIDYYIRGVVDNTQIQYRPDQPHIRLTAPVEGAGVSNIEGKEFEIRWVSYGLGDIENANTNDIEIEYSVDEGSTWQYVKDINNNEFGGRNAPDVETSKEKWTPYYNDNAGADLRTITPYAKPTYLRVRGTEANTQEHLMDISGEFTVAPYFALKKDEGSIIVLPDKEGMNITGNVAFIETWVRPYQFPDSAGKVYPLITKIDSTTNLIHYALNLMYDGRLQFLISDSDGKIRSAYSDSLKPLVRPNSIDLDSSWTHVGAYLYLNGGRGPTIIKFFIDGAVQNDTEISSQLGDDLIVNSLNQYPTYIGYSPSYSFVETSTDTVPAKQTELVKLTGNINSGTPEGVTRSTDIDIYDNESGMHNMAFTFTKTANPNEYDYTITIDGSEIPNQTEEVWVMGNLDYAAADSSTVETTVTLTDFQGDAHDMIVTFTKTLNDREYSIDATINGESVSQSAIFFADDGIVDFPPNITISATDLNLVVGAGSFDEAAPKNIVMHFSDSTQGILTNYAQTSSLNTYIIEVEEFITFNPNGTLLSPLDLTFRGDNINTAVGSLVFDSTLSLKVEFAKAADLVNGLTQFAGANTMSASYHDGTIEEVVTHDITVTHSQAEGFIGELREMRLWNGAPNSLSANGNEPTDLTKYIQGAQAVKFEDILSGEHGNLNRAFSFDGGSFIINGYTRSVGLSPMNDVIARAYGEPVSYVAVEPYLKLVEPEFKQKVANTDNDVRIRWVGFNYDGPGFYPGQYNPVQQAPSLEFSIRGGGGQIIQPYQYIGSLYWKGNTVNSLTLPAQDDYQFTGTGSDVYFAGELNAAIADPDEDNQEPTDDQGPLSASITNARLRLTGEYTINGEMKNIQSEGPLFTVTPASNFTVRALLEGYHTGNLIGNDIVNLPPEYDLGGLKIKLYENNSGGVGQYVGEAESSDGYDERDPTNRQSGNQKFANINFVFTELADGNYWVVVDHLNHLPIMSRYAAPFMYVGDDRTTWQIESGWDFESWNGTDMNVLPSLGSNPWDNMYYTAYGDAYSSVTNPKYSTTGLIYNNGRAGGSTNSMAAMVGGDVVKDGQIDAADRVTVRLNDGTGIISSDITGDGYINATDRTICDRNFGKVSSIYEVFKDESSLTPPISLRDPYNVVSELDPEMSKAFNEISGVEQPALRRMKPNDKKLSPYTYRVWAAPVVNGNYVDLAFYIENQGQDFALANCTFAVTYNSSRLSFVSLEETEEVRFSNNAEIGYSNLRTAPKAGALNPLADVRTIEIDYDAFKRLEGAVVPDSAAYLGTLRFSIKNKNGPIIFKWHGSTALHTVDNQIITDDGDFDDIDPILPYTAKIVQPNGGEELSSNKLYQIEWLTNGTAMVYLEYSRDAGITWNEINSTPVRVDEKYYNWTVPDISTYHGLVRIVDFETDYELDRSDSLFSIIPGFAQVIRPSSGDPIYSGGSTDSIRWVSKGYAKVRFEFSSDAGDNWKSVTPILDAKLKNYKWTIPEVTTKVAVVRMIDGETDEEIARSTMFKILNGSFKFRDPRAGDELIIGTTSRIRWVSSNVDRVDLDYSLDGGNNWDRLQSNVDAKNSYMYWTVDAAASENALLRAIYEGDAEMEFDRTQPFRIISSTRADEVIAPGYEFSSSYPNPTGANAYIDFVLPVDQSLRIAIFDSKGDEIRLIDEKVYLSGNHRITVSAKNLPSGRYYINFKSSKINIIRELNVIK